MVSESGIVFGLVERKPVQTHLPGRVRLVIRKNAFAKIYIRYQGSIREFAVEDFGPCFVPAPYYEQGGNYTAAGDPCSFVSPLEHLPSDSSLQCCGVRIKPLITNLRGRVRIRLRNSEFGRATVHDGNSARHFLLADSATHFELIHEHPREVHYKIPIVA